MKELRTQKPSPALAKRLGMEAQGFRNPGPRQFIDWSPRIGHGFSAGSRKELGARARFYDASVLEHVDAVSPTGGVAHVVGYEHHRAAGLALPRGQKLQKALLVESVHVAKRLVEQ
jgi:hypothetical protein